VGVGLVVHAAVVGARLHLQLAAAQGFQPLVEGLLLGLVSLDDAIEFGLVHTRSPLRPPTTPERLHA
jgi:hypothetical protein